MNHEMIWDAEQVRTCLVESWFYRIQLFRIDRWLIRRTFLGSLWLDFSAQMDGLSWTLAKSMAVLM